MLKKVLILRMDKIGDLLCTLPIDQILDPSRFQTHWVVSKGLGFLAAQSVPSRAYTELDKNNKDESLAKLEQLIEEFRPDVAISIQCPWWVNFTLWKTGIPVRGGVLSKLDSFVFLNKGLRQKRSRALQHESDYNRELLEHALNLPPWQPTNPNEKEFRTPFLTLKSQDFPSLLDSLGITSKSFFVVHPGMAGSALNWPQKHYVSLIQELKKVAPVLITGTPADEEWLTEIKSAFENAAGVHILQNKLKMPELLYILREAKLVIAPSTGVIHLASALGTDVVGFYSPIRVQHPRRWMPRGANKRVLFMPEIKEPELATKEDMELIEVGSVLQQIQKLISI